MASSVRFSRISTSFTKDLKHKKSSKKSEKLGSLCILFPDIL